MSSHLNPPATLTTQERAKFLEIVGQLDPRHFQAYDVPQILTFVRVLLVGEKLAAKAIIDPDKETIASWDRIIRQQTALARSLRLTVQSRADPKSITRLANGRSRPLTYSDILRLKENNELSGEEDGYGEIPSPRLKPWE